ncbi:FtsX-like permease family protein [Herbaspirillum sp. SJZ107]|uniref:FtsX-like permease family protein n=1 Tax=Herbaspirillum sp. SJZ107 TaxID=2572881 RepID=UPI0011540A4D|nr:FtsX-like permease family protein [Herbaspirillum sp. SJZ107]TQK08095.1 putative ABC transport system permease protein [Herbaspirillum sp. SJZ107]
MLRHLLKLTWKRKSRHLMLSLEILLAFAVVFGIAAFALRYMQLYREPAGFDGTDVWSVAIVTGDSKASAIPADVYDTLRRNLKALPEVREVGFVSYSPYTNSTWMNAYRSPQTGAEVATNILEASDDVAAALAIPVVRGRWFSATDEGAPVVPAVMNRRLAAAMFPGQEALGREFTDKDSKRTIKVVGIVDEFRHRSPLMVPVNFIMTRFAPLAGESRVRTIVLKVAPGTPRGFEASLNRQLKLVRNDWSYTIAPLATMRASQMKELLIPLAVLGVIAAFMLAMVAFGLFGVLWQNTARRIPEIGLRRAIGARAADIYRQIVAEQLLLSSVAIVLGLVLLVQLPLTGALGQMMNWPVFLGAAGLSMVVIYLLSLLCSLYPGWRASRLSPAEALHHE